MSAAERLKTLEAPERGYLTSAGMLIDALPQILAVVEAAERLGLSEFESYAWYDVYEALPAALSALDEALS